jgi:hypothetical protein
VATELWLGWDAVRELDQQDKCEQPERAGEPKPKTVGRLRDEGI